MSLDADHIVDRRRMRRKLTFWRVFAVVLAIVAVVAVTLRFTRPDVIAAPRDSGSYIARVTISGLIRNDQERIEALDRLAKSQARAVIVHIDSPGGTAAGAEQLYACAARRGGEEADGGRGRRARGLGRLHRGARRPTTSWRAAPRWSARSACCSSIRTSPTC